MARSPPPSGLRTPPLAMCKTELFSTHMRTNIVIDDKLMADVMKVTGAKTKREAVETGLRTLLRLKQQAGIRKLRGRLKWEGNLEAMRTDA